MIVHTECPWGAPILRLPFFLTTHALAHFPTLFLFSAFGSVKSFTFFSALFCFKSIPLRFSSYAGQVKSSLRYESGCWRLHLQAGSLRYPIQPWG